LLAIGAVVVAGMFAYNRVQERRLRRETERSFASAHDDVLLGAGAQRPAPQPRHEPPPRGRAPDESIDYVIALRTPAPPAAVEEQWQPIQRRHLPRALLAADADGLAWKAGLQLVSRDGSVGEAELIEFRAAVETMAAALGGGVSAPEMKAAMEKAREIDDLCSQTDIQVVLHVVAPPGSVIPAAALEQASGISFESDGSYVQRTEQGQQVFAVAPRDGGGFSLTLDLPHAPETRRSFEAMARLASHIATACGGSVVDDNGNALGEQALEAIAAQLDQVRETLEARGIVPGSPLAVRLFS
jgi:hypothetical protein